LIRSIAALDPVILTIPPTRSTELGNAQRFVARALALSRRMRNGAQPVVEAL
jgi:hypothetical protein